jgi:hypothetical protein
MDHRRGDAGRKWDEHCGGWLCDSGESQFGTRAYDGRGRLIVLVCSLQRPYQSTSSGTLCEQHLERSFTTNDRTAVEGRLVGRQWKPSEAVAAKLAELEDQTNTLGLDVEDVVVAEMVAVVVRG